MWCVLRKKRRRIVKILPCNIYYYVFILQLLLVEYIHTMQMNLYGTPELLLGRKIALYV